MQGSFRAEGNRIKQLRVSRLVASSQAPVADPPEKADVDSGTPIRQLTPDEASRIARARVERSRKARKPQRPALPSLPPPPRATANIAPLLRLVAQTALDMIAIAGAFVLAYWLRFESDIFHKFVQPDAATYGAMLAVTVATIVVTFYFSKLYNLRRGASRVDEFYRIAGAVSMGTVLSLATNSLILGDKFVYSRQILLMGWVFAIFLVTVSRVFFGFIMGELHKRGVDRSRVLVVGTGRTAAMVIDRLQYHRRLGYQVVGVLDETNSGQRFSPSMPKTRVLGDLDEIQGIVRAYDVNEVIVALSGASDKELRGIVARLQDENVSAKIYPDAFQLMTEYEVSVGELSGLPLLNVKDMALRGWNRILKRAFDIAFSIFILTLTAPLMLFISLIIKLTSPGPVFFIQDRVGLDGVAFPLVKFRTMRVEADGQGPGPGEPGWTVQSDPRRTSIGAFLRRFSLDELPQFYNVLIGEMSVVGPRPEQPHYVEQFSKLDPNYMRRHKEKAGITGWAQVNDLRGDTPIEWRIGADLYYVENWSLLFDLKIIARTIYSMVRGKNAY